MPIAPAELCGRYIKTYWYVYVHDLDCVDCRFFANKCRVLKQVGGKSEGGTSDPGGQGTEASREIILTGPKSPRLYLYTSLDNPSSPIHAPGTSVLRVPGGDELYTPPFRSVQGNQLACRRGTSVFCALHPIFISFDLQLFAFLFFVLRATFKDFSQKQRVAYWPSTPYSILVSIFMLWYMAHHTLSPTYSMRNQHTSDLILPAQ